MYLTRFEEDRGMEMHGREQYKNIRRMFIPGGATSAVSYCGNRETSLFLF